MRVKEDNEGFGKILMTTNQKKSFPGKYTKAEEAIQIRLIEFLREVFGTEDEELRWVTSLIDFVPRHRRVQARRMGYQRGTPDLIILRARGVYHGLAVELKSKDGRPSMRQKEMADNLTKAGYLVAFPRGYEKARDLILVYLKLQPHQQVRLKPRKPPEVVNAKPR